MNKDTQNQFIRQTYKSFKRDKTFTYKFYLSSQIIIFWIILVRKNVKNINKNKLRHETIVNLT